MSRPEDIPEDVWKATVAKAMTYIDWLFNGGNPPDTDAEHVLAVTISYAILAERERCAKIAANYAFSQEASDHSNQAVAANAGMNIAAAIRKGSHQ